MRLSRHKPSVAILVLGAAAALAFSSVSAQTSGRTVRPVDDAETKPKLERVTVPTAVPEAVTRPAPVVGTPAVPQHSAPSRSPEQAATGAGMGRGPSAKEAAAVGGGRSVGAGSAPNPVGQGPAIDLAAPAAVTTPDVPRTVDARPPGQPSAADLKKRQVKPPVQVQVLNAPPVQAHLPVLGPQDQQQAPAASDSDASQVRYFAPVGPMYTTQVTGKPGAVKKLIEADDWFVSVIYWEERDNRPCYIDILGSRLLHDYTLGRGGGVAYYPSVDLGCSGLMTQGKQVTVESGRPPNHIPDTPIFSVQVCNNNKKNERLKGIRVTGKFINPADVERARPGESDEESMPNCKQWGSLRSCPENMRATGLVVHAKDVGGGRGQAGITGLQLICREVALR